MAKGETTWGSRLKSSLTLRRNYHVKPLGFAWRSHTLFIVGTVAAGMFSDLFLYGIVVPILPFILRDHAAVPVDQLQRYTSNLLAVFAVSCLIMCPVASWISDRLNSRQTPYLGGLISLIFATVLLFSSETVPLLVVSRILQGASSAFVWSVGMALAMDTVGSKNLGKTFGTLFSVTSVGEVFAPAVGGILYQKSGEYADMAMCLALLVVDLAMRVLIIEKKDAARYIEAEAHARGQDAITADGARDEGSAIAEEPATEETPLISNSVDDPEDEAEKYHIPKDQPWVVRTMPIFYPLFHSGSLILAYAITFGQAFLIAAYDATVPTHAAETYGFNALKAGLLFVPMATVTLLSGPLCGWTVDRYGPKWPTVAGYLWLVPCLTLLRLPKAHPYPQQVYLWAGILGTMGIGISLGGAGSIVEGARVVDLYEKHNPGFFGESGPYAQMAGVMSMCFNVGLTVGPLVAGELKDKIGYGNMNAVLAGVSGLMAILSFIWLGGKPAILKRRRRKPEVLAT